MRGSCRRYRLRAEEASESRVIAGVHYRFDTTVGHAMGEKIGKLVIQTARNRAILP